MILQFTEIRVFTFLSDKFTRLRVISLIIKSGRNPISLKLLSRYLSKHFLLIVFSSGSQSHWVQKQDSSQGESFPNFSHGDAIFQRLLQCFATSTLFGGKYHAGFAAKTKHNCDHFPLQVGEWFQVPPSVLIYLGRYTRWVIFF